MITELSSRLRKLRDQNGWTVADMAERTGIPKRTLDKYMLRSNASLPGFEALCALSRGLGVSMDWLVFGAETASDDVQLVADRAAHDVCLLFAETLLHYHREGREDLVTDERILRLTPEEWAADLGMRAADIAKELVARGVTKSELLTWRQSRSERLHELLRDRVSVLTKDAEDQAHNRP